MSRPALALAAIVLLGGAFVGRQLSHPPLPFHLALQMAPAAAAAGGGLQLRFDLTRGAGH